MKIDKSLSKTLNRRFAQKQNEIQRQPGVMGNGAGNLYPPGLDGFVYVVVAGRALPVFNNRVVAQYGTKVWVGYAPEEPTLFQVLASRSEAPAGSNVAGLGYAPAARYEWLAPNGGQDPLNVHLRAITPLKLGMSSLGGMYVNLFRGFVYTGTEHIAVARQDIDLTAHIPSTSGKAALVLITIDDTGAVVQTKGSEVDITALALSDLPAIPDGTVFACGAVRVYNGQTAVREARANTDFVDLRFTGFGVGGAVSVLDDLDDVDAATPAEGDILVYRSSVWENETPADIASDDADINGINLNESGSDPTAPGTGHRLLYAKADGVYEIDSSGNVTGPMGAVPTAAQVAITDAGGYYSGSDVEAALQEIGAGGISANKYRQFVWAADGSGGWEFVSADDGSGQYEPVFHLEELE